MNTLLLSKEIFEKDLHIFMMIVIALVSSVLMIFVGYKLLQMLQLTGYKLNGFVRWLKETKYSYISRLFMLSFLSIASMLMTNVLLADFFVVQVLSYCSILFYLLFSSLFIVNLFTVKQKTPLKYTKRMTRLVVVFFLLTASLSVGLGYLGLLFIPYLSFGIIGIVPLFLPLIVYAAYYITLPLEKLISNRYIKKAKEKLASRENLVVVGITGSYGKTTVKNILKTILSEKYNVCATPASFNTPHGLSKTILANLDDSHDVLIAEMGAKQVGDIKDLAEMVKPQYALITGVGNQHYLTFGSFEKILNTKAELAHYVADNGGKLYVNVDNDSTKELAKMFKDSICVSTKKGKFDLVAKDIKTGNDGVEFELVYGDKLKKCKTVLLGEHNVSNILLAARVAIDMGLSLDQIAKGIKNISVIPHRLELVKTMAPYAIIDDAYNSSVEGSKAALDVISQYSGKKIVITPGLVELGTEQYKCNFNFGCDMAKVCDLVIIDSALNYKAISDGLIESGFDQEKIIQVVTLKQGVDLLKTVAGKGDVVLFENDLPDNYT